MPSFVASSRIVSSDEGYIGSAATGILSSGNIRLELTEDVFVLEAQRYS
jgi:hypothetical protein